MSQRKGEQNESYVMNWLEDQGYDVLNSNDSGFPDFIVMKNGNIEFFVEVKGGSHKLHPHQRQYHNKIEKLSGMHTKIYRIVNIDITEE